MWPVFGSQSISSFLFTSAFVLSLHVPVLAGEIEYQAWFGSGEHSVSETVVRSSAI